MNLYNLLPRIILENDALLNEGSTTIRSIFGMLYSRYTNPNRFYGHLTLKEPMVIDGIYARLISDKPTKYDFTVQLAINGVPQTGTDLTFNAGNTTFTISFPEIAVNPDDVLSLYIPEIVYDYERQFEDSGVYVEVGYLFNVSPEQETALKKLMKTLQNEVEVDKFLLEGIAQFIDLENAPEILLPYIAKFLGLSLVNEWSSEKKRQFLLGLVNLYHKSGQLLAFHAILNLFDHANTVVYELLKDNVYETTDYYRGGLGGGLFNMSVYGGFYPGSLITDGVLVGFSPSTELIIRGIEATALSRSLTSGEIRVYITVDDVIDYSRYVTIGVGETHNYNPIEPLTVLPTQRVGCYITKDPPESGIEDGWIQVYFASTLGSGVALYSARIEPVPSMSSPVLEAIEAVRPIHVLYLRDFVVTNLNDAIPWTLYDEVSIRPRSSDEDEFPITPGSLFTREKLRNPRDMGVSVVSNCLVYCETNIEPIKIIDFESASDDWNCRTLPVGRCGGASSIARSTTYKFNDSYSSKVNIVSPLTACRGVQESTLYPSSNGQSSFILVPGRVSPQAIPKTVYINTNAWDSRGFTQAHDYNAIPGEYGLLYNKDSGEPGRVNVGTVNYDTGVITLYATYAGDITTNVIVGLRCSYYKTTSAIYRYKHTSALQERTVRFWLYIPSTPGITFVDEKSFMPIFIEDANVACGDCASSVEPLLVGGQTPKHFAMWQIRGNFGGDSAQYPYYVEGSLAKRAGFVYEDGITNPKNLVGYGFTNTPVVQRKVKENSWICCQHSVNTLTGRAMFRYGNYTIDPTWATASTGDSSQDCGEAQDFIVGCHCLNPAYNGGAGLPAVGAYYIDYLWLWDKYIDPQIDDPGLE